MTASGLDRLPARKATSQISQDFPTPSIGNSSQFFARPTHTSLSSWWFQPIINILVNWIIFPNRDENWKCLKHWNHHPVVVCQNQRVNHMFNALGLAETSLASLGRRLAPSLAALPHMNIRLIWWCFWVGGRFTNIKGKWRLRACKILRKGYWPLMIAINHLITESKSTCTVPCFIFLFEAILNACVVFYSFELLGRHLTSGGVFNDQENLMKVMISTTAEPCTLAHYLQTHVHWLHSLPKSNFVSKSRIS